MTSLRSILNPNGRPASPTGEAPERSRPTEEALRPSILPLLAVLAGAGAAAFLLVRRARIRRKENEEGARMRGSIEINADAASVYSVIKQFQLYPAFMSFVRSVEPSEEGHLHWTLEGPAGIRLGWQARLTDLTPLRSIAWESLPNPLLRHAGHFEIEEVSPQKSVLHAELRFGAPLGRPQMVVARLLGMDPRSRFLPDLERIKYRVESGESAPSHRPREIDRNQGRGMRERTGDQSRAGPRFQTKPEERVSSRRARS